MHGQVLAVVDERLSWPASLLFLPLNVSKMDSQAGWHFVAKHLTDGLRLATMTPVAFIQPDDLGMRPPPTRARVDLTPTLMYCERDVDMVAGITCT